MFPGDLEIRGTISVQFAAGLSWRTQQDSNLRPLPSEGSALSS